MSPSGQRAEVSPVVRAHTIESDLKHLLTPLIGWVRLGPIVTQEDRVALMERLAAAVRLVDPGFYVEPTLAPSPPPGPR